jgi:hypothetical protein
MYIRSKGKEQCGGIETVCAFHLFRFMDLICIISRNYVEIEGKIEIC